MVEERMKYDGELVSSVLSSSRLNEFNSPRQAVDTTVFQVDTRADEVYSL